MGLDVKARITPEAGGESLLKRWRSRLEGALRGVSLDPALDRARYLLPFAAASTSFLASAAVTTLTDETPERAWAMEVCSGSASA